MLRLEAAMDALLQGPFPLQAHAAARFVHVLLAHHALWEHVVLPAHHAIRVRAVHVAMLAVHAFPEVHAFQADVAVSFFLKRLNFGFFFLCSNSLFFDSLQAAV